MQDLKVYGVPSAKYDHLIHRLNETIAKKNLQLKIREVYDLSVLIKDGVEKIPTIRLKNHMDLILGDQMEFDEFIKLAEEKIEVIPQESLRSKILVPTDFSSASQKAIQYATMVAEQLDATIELVHIYHPEAISIGTGQIALTYTLEEAQKQMDQLLEERADDITGSVVQGFAASEIIHRSGNYDMIIMCSSGEGNELQKIFGTTASEVGAKSECPVLFIPKNVHSKLPQKAMYAVGKSIKYFDHIACFLRALNAETQFIHIHTDHSDDVESGFEEIQLLKSEYPDIKISINSHQASTVSTGLKEMILLQGPDILIMEKSNPSFFKAITGRSETKEAINTLDIPVLILHHLDKICKCGGLCKKAPKDRCNH